jgi:hypothetical protein
MGYEELDQSVVSDEEAQFAGDVEAPFFEMPYQAGIPPVATDKPTLRVWSDNAGLMRARNAAGAVQNVGAEAAAGAAARVAGEDYQAVAATATSRVFRAMRAGTIEEFNASADNAAGLPAAGESMTLDILINGAPVLTTPILIDDTYVAAGTVVVGAINAAAKAFVRGDLIEIVRTYVAGGGATPLVDTYAQYGIKLA